MCVKFALSYLRFNPTPKDSELSITEHSQAPGLKDIIPVAQYCDVLPKKPAYQGFNARQLLR
jgi:hypothetical protein